LEIRFYDSLCLTAVRFASNPKDSSPRGARVTDSCAAAVVNQNAFTVQWQILHRSEDAHELPLAMPDGRGWSSAASGWQMTWLPMTSRRCALGLHPQVIAESTHQHNIKFAELFFYKHLPEIQSFFLALELHEIMAQDSRTGTSRGAVRKVPREDRPGLIPNRATCWKTLEN